MAKNLSAPSRSTFSGGGNADRETSIRWRAFELWEASGRPTGRALEHWLAAEAEYVAMTREERDNPDGNDPRSVRAANPKDRQGQEQMAPKSWQPSASNSTAWESPSDSAVGRRDVTPRDLPLNRPVSDN